MKPKAHLRAFLLSRPLALATLMTAPLACAQTTLTWDANAATANQTDGAGAWLGTGQWWNASANMDWTFGSNAVFGNNGAGGAVGLASPTTVGSLTFNFFTGTYALGTAGQAITLNNGVTKNAAAGVVTLASPIILGAAQTWTNQSTTNITPQAGINNGGFLLTIDGRGPTVLNTTANVISGDGDLTKTGAGLLILGGAGTNPVHSYTGTTTISGGTVMVYNLGTTGVPSGNLTLNGGVLQDYFGNGGTFNRDLGSGNGQVQITGGASGFSGQGAQASNFNIGGAGATLEWGSPFFNPGTLVLQAASAGVNTNGKMSLANGIDLSGNDRTIASLAATDGAANSGAAIAGVISTSSGTAGITKTGVGNLILTADNTYNGATSIQGGSITLSGTNGAINSTSALTLSGGTLRLVNTTQVNRVADSAVITSTGGTLSYENTSGANVYTETLAAVTHSSGQLNVVESTNQASTGSQTLTLGGLSRSGTASVTFSAGTTSPQASGNKNLIVVTGAGTTAAGQIPGPWATTGTAANAQTDYAVYNNDHVVPANIAASGEGSWSSATDHYTMDYRTSSPVTLTSNRNVNSLRIVGGALLTSVNITTEVITLTGHTFANGNSVVFGANAPGGLVTGTVYFVVGAAPDTFQVSTSSGGAAVNLTSVGTAPTVALSTAPVLTLASGANLGTLGILNGSSFPMTIAPGTGGSVTLPTTSADALHVTSGTNGITISAPVTDNTGALTLVKNGSGSLVLNAANNSYTGDTIVNAGTLQVGVSGSNAQLNSGSYAGNIFIAAGAALTFQGNSANTLSGIISGNGNLNLNRGNTTLSGANTYTGRTSLILVATNALGSTLNVSSFNSVVGGTASSSLGAPTTIANGTIDFGGGGIQQSAQINYTGSGETTDRIINFQFNGNGANRTIDSSGGGLLKFTSPSISNGAIGNNVVLQGSSHGEIVHGLPFTFTNFTKSGAGTWTLGGSIGNTGTTTVSAGTLIINGNQPSATGNFSVNGTSTLGGSGTVSGAVTVAAGASLAPGSPGSTGTLTVKNGLNLFAPANGGAGKLRFDLGPIAASDRIAVGGTLTIGTDVLGFGDFAFTLPGGLQNGTYKLITSGAPVSGTLDPDSANLTGTLGAGPASGTLQISGNDLELVVSGVPGGLSGYGLWSSTNAPSGTPDSDFDGDGVSNAVEFVLGGDKNTNDLGKLPVPTAVGTDLRFTFVRSQASIGNGTATLIESGTLLTGWPNSYNVGANTAGSTPGVTVAKDTPAAGQDTITLTLPQGTDPRKFARLKVTITP